MKGTFYSFLLLSFFLVAGCEKEEPIVPTPAGGNEIVISTINPTGDEAYIDGSSEYIFDQDALHTFHLELPVGNYQTLVNDPSAEQYVEGRLIFEGDTISPVGIRYKGSIGGFVGCVSGSAWWDPSGFKTCTKLSMKVKINWEEREEYFYGLKKLQFHSMNLDPSQMHDRLGYWCFAQMGVPTPRATHAKLMINGAYSGVYALVEQIDSRFVNHNFDDNDGNLYKEVWPLTKEGAPHSIQEYIQALKTNEENNPSVERIREFGQNISDATSDSEIKSIISGAMDIDEIISYCVVDRVIRHDDGPFHWYCEGDECSNHNYYWYEEPTTGRHHLIPWDLDNAFENIKQENNTVTGIQDEWGQSSNNCEPFGGGFLKPDQWSANCDKLTAGWASFSNEFEQLKLDFVNGPLSEEIVNAQIDKWVEQISQATKQAEEAHSDAISVDEWMSAIAELKEELEFARNN